MRSLSFTRKVGQWVQRKWSSFIIFQ